MFTVYFYEEVIERAWFWILYQKHNIMKLASVNFTVFTELLFALNEFPQKQTSKKNPEDTLTIKIVREHSLYCSINPNLGSSF